MGCVGVIAVTTQPNDNDKNNDSHTTWKLGTKTFGYLDLWLTSYMYRA